MQRPLIYQKLRPAGSSPCSCKPMAGVRYITLHMTDRLAAGCGAADCARYLYGGGPPDWHYSVDASEIWQSFHDDRMCLHAGDGETGPGNTTSLGITVCVRTRDEFAAACARAAHLTAYLLQTYGLPIGRIVPHDYWRPTASPPLLTGRWGVTWEGFLAQVTAMTGHHTRNTGQKSRRKNHENQLEAKAEQP